MSDFIQNSNLLLLLFCEILFAAHVGMGIWVALLRNKIKQQNSELEQREQAQLDQSEAPQASPEEIAGSDTGQAQLVNEQRIKNLERFRKLYLELSDKLEGEVANREAQDKQLAELNRLLNSQNHVITTLKRSIDEISNKYSLEQDSRAHLESQITKLEDNADALKDELERANKRLLRDSMLEDEISHFKDRVFELEQSERQLIHEAQNYRQALEENQNWQENPHPYGKVDIAEMDQLTSKLAQKDKEISLLRSECDTIAKQYEELASSSLTQIESMQTTTTEEQINIQQLQTILDQSARALEEKKQEVQQLEQALLAQNSSPTDETKEQYKQKLTQQNELEVTFFDTVEQAVELFDDIATDEMKILKQSMNEKSDSLKMERNELLNVREQVKLDNPTSTQQLQEENQKLKQQIEQYKRRTQQLQQKEKEIMRLNFELEKLENKYLELIDKQ